MSARFARSVVAGVILYAWSSCSLLVGAVPAFPGAEGFGAFSTGGRGGEIYRVTTLNDSGPGSFRDAVSRPHRMVVFDVGGIIYLSNRVSVASNLTIAGQTAPGDGITVYGNGISYSDANDTITRYLRYRMGVNGDHGRDAVTIARGNRMIFDHVSVSWGRDENFSVSGVVSNITIQNCLIAQGLQPHSCGGLIQTVGGVSILRTLYIDNHTRNPKVKGVNQFVNNVIYNWGGGGGYILGGSASQSFANVAGNYFISGPDTRVAAFSRGNLNFHLFAADNFLDGDRNGRLDGGALTRANYGTVSWRQTAFDFPKVAALPPEVVLSQVAFEAGASLPRDAVDAGLIGELLSLGAQGEIVDQEPALETEARPATSRAQVPSDSDGDGIPDAWERVFGFNPTDRSDGNTLTEDGYTRLEAYLNWLAEPHALTGKDATVAIDLQRYARGFEPTTTRFTVSEPTHGQVTLVDEHLARFQPAPGFVGLAGFRVGVEDTHEPGWRASRSVSVLVFAPE